MKKKNYITIIPIFLLLWGMLSCSQEYDDIYYYPEDNSHIDMGLTETIGVGEYDFLIHLDDGSTLHPQENRANYFTVKDSQRVQVTYTILSRRGEEDNHPQYNARINDLIEILYKDLIPYDDSLATKLGSDYIGVTKDEIAQDILTLKIRYPWNGQLHVVNLADMKAGQYNPQDTLELRLFRNSYNAPPNLYYEGYISFNLKSARREGVSKIPYKLRYTDLLEREQIIEGEYDYSSK